MRMGFDMAFKILTEDEIKLLTDKQRIQYENQLAIYNERVKFVEQLEKLENVEIKPYEPTLTCIPAVGLPPEKIFTAPLYDIKITEQVIKVQSKYDVVDFIKPAKAVLPECSKITNIKTDNLKAIEHVKPALPEINNAAASVKIFTKMESKSPILPKSKKVGMLGITFKKPQQAKPDLPAVIKPDNYANLDFTPVIIDNRAITANNPTAVTSQIALTKFVSPEKSQPVLPKLSVAFSDVKAFEKPEHTLSDLPKAVVPQDLPQQAALIKQTKISQANLPEISNISPVTASFNKPKIKDTQLPSILKVNAPECSFVKSEHNFTALPTVLKPQAVSKPFNMIQCQKPSLPFKGGVCEEHRLEFNMAQCQKPTLPAVDKSAISKLSFKAFNKPDKNISKLDYPTISINKIKPYKNITVKANGLPDINNLAILDKSNIQSIKDIFFANKKTETSEGANI